MFQVVVETTISVFKGKTLWFALQVQYQQTLFSHSYLTHGF
jgi:hypothetical protein